MLKSCHISSSTQNMRHSSDVSRLWPIQAVCKKHYYCSSFWIAACIHQCLKMDVVTEQSLCVCACRWVPGGNPPGVGVQAELSEQRDHRQSGENTGRVGGSVPENRHICPAALWDGLTCWCQHHKRSHRFTDSFILSFVFCFYLILSFFFTSCWQTADGFVDPLVI